MPAKKAVAKAPAEPASDFTTKTEAKKHAAIVVTMGFEANESNIIGLSVMETFGSLKVAQGGKLLMDEWAMDDVNENGDVFYATIVIDNPKELKIDPKNINVFGGEADYRTRVKDAIVANPELIFFTEGKPKRMWVEEDDDDDLSEPLVPAKPAAKSAAPAKKAPVRKAPAKKPAVKAVAGAAKAPAKKAPAKRAPAAMAKFANRLLG